MCNECRTSASFQGRSVKECLKAARSAGWYAKDNKELCPKHKQIQSDRRRREHGQ